MEQMKAKTPNVQYRNCFSEAANTEGPLYRDKDLFSPFRAHGPARGNLLFHLQKLLESRMIMQRHEREDYICVTSRHGGAVYGTGKQRERSRSGEVSAGDE